MNKIASYICQHFYFDSNELQQFFSCFLLCACYFVFCSISGPNTSADWAIEGRRLIPLMPRLVPQTAFTALANNVANIAAAENAKLPPPANTIKKNCKSIFS
jgi:hypothetical protein